MSENISTITPQKLGEIIASGQIVELIDVRTPVEFRACHATPARNVPLDSLDPQAIAEVGKEARESGLYLICQSGKRAQMACGKFQALGYSQVMNVEGGTQAWMDAGLPVVRGKKAVSIERQTRIAAGTLVLTGVLLGWLVHPAFVAISAFVGAGLVFSGVTDSCAMGMALAKMPWNQVSMECEVGDKQE